MRIRGDISFSGFSQLPAMSSADTSWIDVGYRHTVDLLTQHYADLTDANTTSGMFTSVVLLVPVISSLLWALLATKCTE